MKTNSDGLSWTQAKPNSNYVKNQEQPTTTAIPKSPSTTEPLACQTTPSIVPVAATGATSKTVYVSPFPHLLPCGRGLPTPENTSITKKANASKSSMPSRSSAPT